jgi:predicted O-methyltransferase YrrM
MTALQDRAREHAARLGFWMRSEETTDQVLALLAAATPPGGRILELGTATGLGTASIVAGLGDRTDVEVVTVELEERVAEVARDNDWPDHVRFEVGDAVALLPRLGTFSFVFADAQGGKWTGLDRTIAAVAPGGWLLVDDMQPQPWWTDEHAANQHRVRRTLFEHPELVSVETPWSSGLILCVKRLPDGHPRARRR